MDMRRQGLLAFFLAVAGVAGTGSAVAAPPQSLVVFAASSLSSVLQEVGDAYARDTGQAVTLSFAASSSLAHQIEGGSSADLFLPADEEWMDYLEKRHLIDPGSRRNLLRNRLVLIAAAASPIKLKIGPGFGLADALGKSKLATGDPESVPAGRYTRYALISLGVWNSVAEHLAPAGSVRATMASVMSGDTPLGIVYETDALKEKGVRIVDVFPPSSHPQIVYPVATTPKAKAETLLFVEFLRGPEARKIFAQYGYRAAQ
jgi:molybdate transport system substrate-binding protein